MPKMFYFLNILQTHSIFHTVKFINLCNSTHSYKICFWQHYHQENIKETESIKKHNCVINVGARHFNLCYYSPFQTKQTQPQ